MGLYRGMFKRIIDLSSSTIALVLLSPVLLIVALLVRVKLGQPVLFKQLRPGLKEKLFTLYKFRTMSDETDRKGDPLPDNFRLSGFGRFLRSSSLDELPELINIIKGDMSIVGPRPLAVDYLPYYKENEKKRHTVRPGLTGLAQVNGRNSLSWEERFAYDIHYVENISFWLDLRIIFKTIKKVIKKEDIGERGTNSLVDFDVYRQNSHSNE
jgi:lipopolysaccharide/colanic/teichoic acid biosynthesis glycosyltransferase